MMRRRQKWFSDDETEDRMFSDDETEVFSDDETEDRSV